MEGTGALEDLLIDLDDFALVVEGFHRAHVVAAIRAVGAALAELPATTPATAPWVSPAAALPRGPAVRVNDLCTQTGTRRRAAAIIRETLHDHGVDHEAATVLAVDGLQGLDRCPRAVILRLFPEPARSAGVIDPSWVDIASEWVFGDLTPGADIRMRILGVEVAVDAAEAAGVMHGCVRTRTWCDVLTGDIGSRVRTASLSFGDSPHVAIGAGGPKCDDEGLLARFALLQEVATELAGGVAYACVDFEDSFAGLGTGLVGSAWSSVGGAPAHVVTGRLVDRFVPEACPFQILGRGHEARLRSADRSGPIGDRLAGDRWAVAVGDPGDWLPASDGRVETRADAWDRLRPLLLGADELDEIDDDRPITRPVGRPADDELGSPALDDVVIEATPQPRRGTHVTVLELAAWLAGEPHGDAPASVSRVVATFARHLGAGLGDERRQALKHVAGQLVGSGPADAALEDRRAWMVVHWLVARHTGAWLRAASLAGTADRLARLPWPLDDLELVRAVDLLDSAITTGGRRCELARTRAGDDHADAVLEVAWEAWELAADRTGWVAASEAIGEGLPADLVHAVDHRVIDCSRDPRSRAELQATRRSLGDAAWAAALHEMASSAWRAAWVEMETYVHHESTFSLQTTVRRSVEGRVGPDADGVLVDLLIDDVDAAVSEALARQLLAGEETRGAWKRGIDAAARTETGSTWSDALAEARRALGELLYDDAMAIGEAELRRHLDQAPQLVGRAVATAVAREAAGVAGRSLAASAAAGSLAAGGSMGEARTAAATAMQPVVDELADDAVRLLAALVAARSPRG